MAPPPAGQPRRHGLKRRGEHRIATGRRRLQSGCGLFGWQRVCNHAPVAGDDAGQTLLHDRQPAQKRRQLRQRHVGAVHAGERAVVGAQRARQRHHRDAGGEVQIRRHRGAVPRALRRVEKGQLVALALRPVGRRAQCKQLARLRAWPLAQLQLHGTVGAALDTDEAPVGRGKVHIRGPHRRQRTCVPQAALDVRQRQVHGLGSGDHVLPVREVAAGGLLDALARGHMQSGRHLANGVVGCVVRQPAHHRRQRQQQQRVRQCQQQAKRQPAQHGEIVVSASARVRALKQRCRP
jgi:hypothetical protein